MKTNHFQKRNSFSLKALALLSTIRWKNILFIGLAQYLSFLFAFNNRTTLATSILEIKVHLIILSTAFILAAGYIINNFYDLEKDLINRPFRTRFQNLISNGFKLKFYFLLNFIGLSIAYLASWRIFTFFIFYTFLLWLYSHKMSKIVFIRELTASFLTVLAFFSLALYFKIINVSFILYGTSLFFTLFARELYKDIIWIKGDIIQGYQSVASTKGIHFSSQVFQILLLSSCTFDIILYTYLPRNAIFWIILILGILKLILLLLINRDRKPIHRLLQLLILIYILGIIWL